MAFADCWLLFALRCSALLTYNEPSTTTYTLTYKISLLQWSATWSFTTSPSYALTVPQCNLNFFLTLLQGAP
ncbi:hypothetical protein GOP47_0008348 [Adiantum capillus-veneris]|uniref:Secreted protein n=1 Tax=Adiantum capillus-veneris TaxID=13818 RepID=A0A9D4ZHY9_ADICA|nr:hypothetical protein GOP47_0008348 [Adiantum capillus-veneris]